MANILLLEDEAPLRAMIAKMLEKAGHAVTQSGDGKIALDDAMLLNTDLLITDIIMPETDGLEVISRAASVRNKLKIIAMSGGGRVLNRDYLPDAVAFGAAVTLQKPFSPGEMMESVDSLLAV